MKPRRYNVTIPRVYTANGQQKTHFWLVGTAFPLKNQEGLSLKLYSKMLVTDQFVLFPVDEEEQASSTPAPPEEDLPF